MKLNKYILKVVGFLLIMTYGSTYTIAQQDEQLSMYNFNPLYYNPAYAGSKSALSVVAMGRFQWVNFDGAPNTQFVSAHTPVLGRSLGMGLTMVNDQVGSRKRTAVYYNVSSGIRLNNNNDRLAFGLSIGMDVMAYDFSGLDVHDVSDPFYGQTVSTTKANVGGGIYYYNDRYYVGVSSPRLLEPKASNTDDIMTSLNQRHFFITAGKVFDLNSVIKLKPTTLVKITPNSPLTFDVNANFLFYERVWVGALYRFHEAVGLNFVYNFNDFIHVGYGYDFPINKLINHQSGSHEVLLQIDIGSKKNVFISPRYF
nr:type IX secretion system membrane protein PorP/SprF [uncultured Brumimicrobium sp.]